MASRMEDPVHFEPGPRFDEPTGLADDLSEKANLRFEANRFFVGDIEFRGHRKRTEGSCRMNAGFIQ